MHTGQAETQGLFLQFRQRLASSTAISRPCNPGRLRSKFWHCGYAGSCEGIGVFFGSHVGHRLLDLLVRAGGRPPRGHAASNSRYMELRAIASSKSTRWPSKSGPSTQANLVSPPTVRRQPPHMPVPSIMMGFMLTTVLIPYFFVTSHTILHHGQGTDCDHFIILVPIFKSVSSISGHKAGTAVQLFHHLSSGKAHC